MAFLDKTGLERLWSHIVSRLNNKVDKIEGMGLSTNDYTTADKEQLNTLSGLVGDTAVSTQINNAVATKANAVNGIVQIANGGTGASSIIGARENLFIFVGSSAPTTPIEGMLWFQI